MGEREELKKLTVRLHDDLYEQVKRIAGGHHRSMNGEIAVVLTGYIARETKTEKKEKKRVKDGATHS